MIITLPTRCLSIGKHTFPITDTPILIDDPVGKTYFLQSFTEGFPTTHCQPTHGLYPFLTSMGRCPEQRGLCLMNRDSFDSHVCGNQIRSFCWMEFGEEEEETMPRLVNGQKLSNRGLGFSVWYINEENVLQSSYSTIFHLLSKSNTLVSRF